MHRTHVLVICLSLFVSSGRLDSSSLCATITTEEPDREGLPRATLEIIDLNNPSVQYSAAANKEGRACVPKMADGIYSVEASSSGFMHVRYYPVRVAYPDNIDLTFRLPFGEIREGGIGTDVVVSGTLREKGVPLDGVRICLSRQDPTAVVTCTDTNDLGQYAAIVRTGKYRVELSRLNKSITVTIVDFPTPGIYRNLFTVETH